MKKIDKAAQNVELQKENVYPFYVKCHSAAKRLYRPAGSGTSHLSQMEILRSCAHGTSELHQI